MFFDAREGVTMLQGGKSAVASTPEPFRDRQRNHVRGVEVDHARTQIRYLHVGNITIPQVRGGTAMPIPDGNDASIFKISKRSCRKTLQMCLDIPLEFLNADPVVILGHAKIGIDKRFRRGDKT